MPLPAPFEPEWWRQWLAGIETEGSLDLAEAEYGRRKPSLQHWQQQQIDQAFADRRRQMKGVRHG